MKLKRFVATDTAKAMRMIKDTFGPDAVILSSHSVDEGVEVVAAVDYDESVINQQEALQAVEEKSNSQQEPSTVVAPLDEMKEEIQTLRCMLETQLASPNRGLTPLHQLLNHRLTNLGFSQQMINYLIRDIDSNLNRNQAWAEVLHKVSQAISIYPGRRIEESGVYAFVGATGVGKTTTMAKLAARFCLRFGAQNLGLITTDAYRIAAHEQLLTYGKILGVNVCLAEDEASLTRTLQKLADKKLILIDTAGMNPSDERVAVQMQAIQKQACISTVMVMSATSHYQVLHNAVKAYQNYAIDQCILTKIDEAVGVGGAISAHFESKIPFSYITNGQRVPEDIKLAVKDKLLEKINQDDALFSSNQQESPGNDSMAVREYYV